MAIRKQSENRKAARARSRANGEARKKARVAKQAAAQKVNKERGFTAWDQAKAARAKAREGKKRAQTNEVGHVVVLTAEGATLVCDHRNHKDNNEQYTPATGAENLAKVASKGAPRKKKASK